jgi:hypothetical protein
VAKKPQRQSALEVAVNVHLEQRLAQEELERIRNMSSDQRTQALLIG